MVESPSKPKTEDDAPAALVQLSTHYGCNNAVKSPSVVEADDYHHHPQTKAIDGGSGNLAALLRAATDSEQTRIVSCHKQDTVPNKLHTYDLPQFSSSAVDPTLGTVLERREDDRPGRYGGAFSSQNAKRDRNSPPSEQKQVCTAAESSGDTKEPTVAAKPSGGCDEEALLLELLLERRSKSHKSSNNNSQQPSIDKLVEECQQQQPPLRHRFTFTPNRSGSGGASHVLHDSSTRPPPLHAATTWPPSNHPSSAYQRDPNGRMEWETTTAYDPFLHPYGRWPSSRAYPTQHMSRPNQPNSTLSSSATAAASHNKNSHVRAKQRKTHPQKRRRSAYNMFFSAERQRMIQEQANDKLTFQDISRLIGQRWKSVSQLDRQFYRTLAADQANHSGNAAQHPASNGSSSSDPAPDSSPGEMLPDTVQI